MVRASQLILPVGELSASARELNSIPVGSLKLRFLEDKELAKRSAADIIFPDLPGQPKVRVSGHLMQLAAELASNLAVGNAVAIVSVPPYITVGEAAKLLGISQRKKLSSL
jgi:hypothetical protein